MSMKRCMNAGCGGAAAVGGAWRKGWMLRSGTFATLCDKCGVEYEQLAFCDKFHQNESGWRECAFCGKRLHCGCIASKSFLDLLDGGGVQCFSCLNNSRNSLTPSDIIQDLLPQSSQKFHALSARCYTDERMIVFSALHADGSSVVPTSYSPNNMNDDVTANGKFMQLGRNFEVNGDSTVVPAQGGCSNGSFGHVKQEQIALHIGELGHPNCSGQDQGLLGLLQVSNQIDTKNALKDTPSNPLAQACLSMNLGGSNMGSIMEASSKAGAWQIAPLHHGVVDDRKEQNKTLITLQHVQRARHLLPKLPNASHGATSEPPKELIPQMRIARPPAEGRGRNQLLPRYWPRITDQELQQISGDSNSTIVPLFEKVLSASDAGRIGRLVLPKACAEAYFPPISQPEGLPLKIQDAKGKEWHFQFRFWPNNNSRMYVLEGVTPCIQSLQLQAGDTVTFSRIDPEGKLVMGYRKATNTVALQDSQISAIANGALSCEALYSGVNENLSLTDKHGSWTNEGLPQTLLVPDKRSRNIGSTSKRLLMDSDDAMELKLTWEEAQDLFRPPPRVKPSIVIIEDQEFEEYEEPPVFGKRTFFTVQASGVQDQWIQCDDCFRWRRIPVEFLPPSKWACADNTWDSNRSSCAVPDELTSRELQVLLLQHADTKRRRIATSSKSRPSDIESTGLDALANAAVLGDSGTQAPPFAAATTTRHPRHRPGCTCIVCIQPPSGKGPKHSPACTCNVCMTVKRRFKTFMMRKKKRQSECEVSELSKKLPWNSTEEPEMKQNEPEIMDDIDLNCQPQREAVDQTAATSSSSSPQVTLSSMTSLVQVAGLPLENYLKQSRIASLTGIEQQHVSSSSPTVLQASLESETGGDDQQCGSDKVRSDGAA
ncbi:B3 domain-containing protein [Apostasia shenzhenica]|uniref:B3 domain-containing protein n=1 Tax=Apostasia shenzhenica TaxID=1088818 RepID=A0A2I0BGE9_9ASPA|nr:B3 domain-containing protein [Apostasia shenzhenica]